MLKILRQEFDHYQEILKWEIITTRLYLSEGKRKIKSSPKN